MTAFAYTLCRRHRPYALAPYAYLTVTSRNARIRTRMVYGDLRRRGVSAIQARTVVCELLAAGQCALHHEPMSTGVAVMGTDQPLMRFERRAVTA